MASSELRGGTSDAARPTQPPTMARNVLNASTSSTDAPALQAALAAEEDINQQERILLERAAALERQVQQHKAKKNDVQI